MAMSAKGIQYTYLVNYLNQVPTRVKSQVHDLPPLAVPNSTPVDIYLSQTAYLPAGDERFAFAAQQNNTATGTTVQTTPAGASQSTSTQGLVGNTATAAPVVTSAAGTPAAAPVSINTTPVAQPQAEQVAAQTTPPYGELSQAVLPMNQNFAAPLPSQVEKDEANRPAEAKTTSATAERERAEAEKAKEEKTEYIPPVSLEAEIKLLTGGDILNPQALRLYELISGAGLVNVGNIIDTRS